MEIDRAERAGEAQRDLRCIFGDRGHAVFAEGGERDPERVTLPRDGRKIDPLVRGRTTDAEDLRGTRLPAARMSTSRPPTTSA